MTINCGLESQAENLILEHCAACDSDGSKCLKMAADDAGLVFEDADDNWTLIYFESTLIGKLIGVHFAPSEGEWLTKSQMIEIAERMG